MHHKLRLRLRLFSDTCYDRLTSKLVFPLMWPWMSTIAFSTASASLSTIFRLSSMTAMVATSSASKLSSRESLSSSKNWTRAPTSSSIFSFSLCFFDYTTNIHQSTLPVNISLLCVPSCLNSKMFILIVFGN